jgi:type IV secretory pathway TrbL component
MPILISASALFFMGRLAAVRNRAAGTAAQSTAAASPLYQAAEGHRP